MSRPMLWPVRTLRMAMPIWIGAAIVAVGCRAPAARSDVFSIESAADEYVRIVVALSVRDPDSLDSYFGPSSVATRARTEHRSLAEIRRAATDLLARIEAGGALEPRRAFLARQLRAVDARIDFLTGTRRTFAEESRLIFGVDPPRMDDAQTAAVRRELDELVPGTGSLTRRVADFQRRFLVPADRVPTVFTRAVDACRRATREHIELPEDEHVEVVFVGESPWSAFTRYEGQHRSRITVNASAGFTVDDVLQLACHEAYPGHHAMNVLVDDRLVRAERRNELTVQLLFSPQATLSEGAASIAPQIAFSDAERLNFERSALFPAAGLSADGAERSVRVGMLLDKLAAVRC